MSIHDMARENQWDDDGLSDLLQSVRQALNGVTGSWRANIVVMASAPHWLEEMMKRLELAKEEKKRLLERAKKSVNRKRQLRYLNKRIWDLSRGRNPCECRWVVPMAALRVLIDDWRKEESFEFIECANELEKLIQKGTTRVR